MKLQILNNIAKEGLDLLTENKFELVSDQNNVSGIVLRSHDLHSLVIDNSLHAIARAGAGTNNINVDDCSEKGVVVFNTPGANANAVKEMVICSLILSKRDLVSGNKNLDSIDTENLNDEEISKKIENMKKEFVGEEIRGKKLSIIKLALVFRYALHIAIFVYPTFVVYCLTFLVQNMNHLHLYNILLQVA